MKGLIIWMKDGNGSDESLLDELGTEIRQRGGRVEVFHSKAAEKLGMQEDEKARSEACAMLARHGVVVIASGTGSCTVAPDEEIDPAYAGDVANTLSARPRNLRRNGP